MKEKTGWVATDIIWIWPTFYSDVKWSSPWSGPHPQSKTITSARRAIEVNKMTSRLMTVGINGLSLEILLLWWHGTDGISVTSVLRICHVVCPW